MINIEKNIPITADGNSLYPFQCMDVGDSFFVVREGRVRQAAHNYGARTGKKFTVRKQENGVRVWRIN